MAKPTISIEYCTSCNYTTRALWIAAEILPDFQFDISALVLVQGDKGVFDVSVDDVKVFIKAMVGRFPDPDDLKQAIFEEMEKAS